MSINFGTLMELRKGNNKKNKHDEVTPGFRLRTVDARHRSLNLPLLGT